jgi:hypothetical protein
MSGFCGGSDVRLAMPHCRKKRASDVLGLALGCMPDRLYPVYPVPFDRPIGMAIAGWLCRKRGI